ncbi:lysine arginine ornithine ABC transporter, ATP-binding protein [Desulfosarcina variabilis str. Montpellier]|uniref:ABC transporter ATP-binding protein n=1 Tax=Desulfosarcina variabilis TaxID=2300 RepID=UPI003AFADE49
MHNETTVSHPPALKVENLHKRFGTLEVLKGISLTAHQGDVISLIGSSGSGKSTLLRCINLLEIPNSGHVWVNGERIEMTTNRKGETIPQSSRQVDRIRSKLGMVFQQFNLWTHMTIMENVIEAPVHVLGQNKKEAKETAMALLEKVGIADKAKSYPAHLSGGQQQRAAIARALAMEPTVMLLDEPTSALDPELVGDVLAVMRQLAEEGRTMLVATHEMDFCRDVSTQVIFLDEGRVGEQGSPEKVFNAPESVRCRQFLSRFLWQDQTNGSHNTQDEQKEER